jgi:putative ABC transport system permease protein
MFRITLKGLLGHKLRFALTAFAVTLGVAFVVGAFVLTDSVRAQFNTLFEDINAGIDLQVRGEEQFDTQAFGGQSGAPVPEELLPEIQGIEGVSQAAGTAGGTAQLVDADGELIEKPGGFPLGLNWSDAPELATVTVVEGSPPEADDEIVVDVDTADLGDLAIGDTVQVITPLADAPAPYQLVGLVSFGENNALAGATLTGFTTPEAQRLFNLEGRYQTIEIAVEEGTDPAAVEERIAAMLPPGFEVVDQQTVIDEGQESIGAIIDIFLNVLLGFGFVILFVSMFLIYNTFRIVVGQRVRELALLRAVGASSGQVFRSVLGEALFIGLISSILGFGLGVVVAIGLNALLNASGFGAGEAGLVLTPTPFIWALAVGLIVTLVSALPPARQTTRVPPVAAMRDGFSLDAGSNRVRFIVGIVVLGLGVLIGVSGLTADEGSAVLTGMALGAILFFLGIAALSPLFASPVSRLLGAPFRVFRITGRLSSENAARSPRRTSATASALMVGLALVTMALVVGNSIKVSFSETLENTIAADWYVDTSSFVGFSPAIADQMAALPELSAVNQGRFGAMQVNGSTKQFTALDYATINDMFDLGITAGEIPPDSRGVLVGSDPAEELGLAPGDEITAIFNETGAVTLPVLAVYEEDGVVGNWVIDLQTQEENFTDISDFFVAATTADGVEPDEARAAIEAVTEPFPSLRVQDAEEFRDSQEGQVDSVLIVVNVFLLFAIIIAGFGIANTLALSVFERTRELGLLRAIGETKGQVWLMITLEAMIVAGFGAFLGIAIGVAFGVATASALPESFITTIVLPWGSLVGVMVVAVILGILASIFPAWRASRMNVLDAISYE